MTQIDGSRTQVVYVVSDDGQEAEALIGGDGPLPRLLVDYLMERRRAIITELRKLEDMLDLPQSIPVRRRAR